MFAIRSAPCHSPSASQCPFPCWSQRHCRSPRQWPSIRWMSAYYRYTLTRTRAAAELHTAADVDAVASAVALALAVPAAKAVAAVAAAATASVPRPPAVALLLTQRLTPALLLRLCLRYLLPFYRLQRPRLRTQTLMARRRLPCCSLVSLSKEGCYWSYRSCGYGRGRSQVGQAQGIRE